MADIKVPFEELQRLIVSLDNVMGILEHDTTPLNFQQTLGDANDVIAAAVVFDDRWNDGREQIRNEGKQIRDKVQEVVEAFKATDDALADGISE